MQRFGVQLCLAAGTILLAATASAFVFVRSATELVLLYVVFGICYSLGGMIPLIAFCTTWFGATSSTAIGLLLTGFGFAGSVWPPLVGFIGDHYGWRRAYALVPIATFFVAVPLTLCGLKDGPCDERRPASGEEGCAASTERGVVDATPLHSGLDLVPGEAWDAEVVPPGRPPRSCLCAPELRSNVTGALACSSCSPPASGGGHGARRREARIWWSAASLHLAIISFGTLYIVVSFMNSLGLFLKHDANMSLSSTGAYTGLVFATSLFGKVLYGVGSDS
eukprot:CAMPEP_0170306224 /NCGR_PEP_ID=MMETSP0116_2-20130129/53494_1 /TAXON_ID=400756 /ORGANISM="Durinskia baltica, Strain CSIRO CS-38" /LENGTH=278 /DNA_ID=CAMNT_0010558291 /DNA_START=33 /DNA_END=866 /DNA_ORIENTATION=+